MNLRFGLGWLTGRGARQSEKGHDASDLGDMGTAFGLDASMASGLDEPPSESSTSQAEASSKGDFSSRRSRR